MLIALWENHHASGIALKVLAIWAGAVNDSDPCANCYTHSKRRSSVTAKAYKKWRLSPLLSPCSRPDRTGVVAGVAGVACSLALGMRDEDRTGRWRACREDAPNRIRQTKLTDGLDGDWKTEGAVGTGQPSDRRDHRSLGRRVWRLKPT